jgi:uncharacterized membrane protein YeiB
MAWIQTPTYSLFHLQFSGILTMWTLILNLILKWITVIVAFLMLRVFRMGPYKWVSRVAVGVARKKKP